MEVVTNRYSLPPIEPTFPGGQEIPYRFGLALQLRLGPLARNLPDNRLSSRPHLFSGMCRGPAVCGRLPRNGWGFFPFKGLKIKKIHSDWPSLPIYDNNSIFSLYGMAESRRSAPQPMGRGRRVGLERKLAEYHIPTQLKYRKSWIFQWLRDKHANWSKFDGRSSLFLYFALKSFAPDSGPNFPSENKFSIMSTL